MFSVDACTGYVIYTYLTNGSSQWAGNLIYVLTHSFWDDVLLYPMACFNNTRNPKAAKRPEMIYSKQFY